MSEDLKSELVRAGRHYAPPRDAFQRLRHRQERQRRQVRSTALLVGLIVAALSVGLVWLAVHSHGRRQPGGAPVVPTNGEILYAKKLPGGWHLFAVDPSSGEERQITDGVRDYGSDWSPDGTEIVYDSESGSGYDIVIANADGTDRTVVGTGQDPAWSPDGTRIAYVGPENRIWIMSADGGDAHPITGGPSAAETGQNAPFDWNPVWSPDGHSIAYVRVAAHRLVPVPSGEGRTDVTLQEIRIWHDGVDPTDTMLSDAYTNVGELDWSPDGSTIVFTGAPTLFHEKVTNGLAWPRVLLIPADGGEVTAISPAEKTWAAGATWSPDGEWIAYVDNNHALVVMRPNGADRRTLSIDPGEDEIIGPSWGASPPASA
jgi:Tol biopolymer transport system component